MKRRFRLRKPLFFPLNYGDRAITDFRSLIADFKCKRENSELFYCGRQPKRDDSGRAFELGLISAGESVVESFLSPALPDGAFNRQADNWRPLFAIAEIAGGGDWPKRCADAFEKLTVRSDNQTGSIRVDLLADIQIVFREGSVERIFSRDLIEALVAMTERP